MIKSELIANLSAKMTNLPEATVAKGVNIIIEEIIATLVDGNRIEVRGFGSFCLHHRASRNAHNPRTGEKVFTEEKKTPHFKAGKDLRDRINSSKNKYEIKED